jgi:spore germination protein
MKWLLFFISFSIATAHPFRFQEIWTYLIPGEEDSLKGSEAITDICYFAATVDDTGRIKTNPNIERIPSQVRDQRKIHLVVNAPNNVSLMYWLLMKDRETKQALIQDLVRISEHFDGLQIDFETIRPEDRHGFWQFLKEIKEALPAQKIFSVAVLARTSDQSDAFNYQRIAPIVDRVFVMAYDEHWRTGPPGTIASLHWCENICQFAQATIPKEKLILGLPLYGRVWQIQEVSRPLKYFQALQLLDSHQITLQYETDGSSHFQYHPRVDALVYFENIDSLSKKLSLYHQRNIGAVGFWRAGQEPTQFWDLLKRDDSKEPLVLE